VNCVFAPLVRFASNVHVPLKVSATVPGPRLVGPNACVTNIRLLLDEATLFAFVAVAVVVVPAVPLVP
jgi:hypothetical protein